MAEETQNIGEIKISMTKKRRKSLLETRLLFPENIQIKEIPEPIQDVSIFSSRLKYTPARYVTDVVINQKSDCSINMPQIKSSTEQKMIDEHFNTVSNYIQLYINQQRDKYKKKK